MTSEERDMLVRIDENVKQLVEDKKDHENRLRSLERFKNWLMAIIGLGSAGGGVTQL